jgi:hypothetical protein
MPATAQRRRELSLLKRRRVTDEGCWEWTGWVNKTLGYGQYRTNEKNLYVHRVAYELYVGPIPDEHEVHHRCENRACFNPAHLEAMDRIEHRHHHHGYRSGFRGDCPAWKGA